MGATRRSRKPPVDYKALVGMRKPRSSTSAAGQRARTSRKPEKAPDVTIVKGRTFLLFLHHNVLITSTL
jgi:hypothetical protein